MSIVVAVLFETDRLCAEELRWPLRIGGDVTFLVAATAESAKVSKMAVGLAVSPPRSAPPLALVRKYVSDRPTVRVTYRVEDDLK